MGLSLRDLQEALYEILGAVLSVNAINRITLKAQKQMLQVVRLVLRKPFYLIVDGVWRVFNVRLKTLGRPSWAYSETTPCGRQSHLSGHGDMAKWDTNCSPL
ncbi:hypothetical protein [Acaryochloris sp. CCMEE 5410]|uniref:hypothetical protein n=1 Tax=Acaryochloris sp. CCMEE 5410 TaxID=310037 RepID=UPI0021D08F54|nr:hypothetical protein [Acaryochloris sp. CCMEE 5410]KAI9129119.1 hypothetical protein ON05_036450 [Acaryochloris sp. CCMEE 5410]